MSNKTNICDSCNQDINIEKETASLRNTSKIFRDMAKQYCKEHETNYRFHKCKPIWCKECNYLEKYEIILKKEEVY